MTMICWGNEWKTAEWLAKELGVESEYDEYKKIRITGREYCSQIRL